MGKKAPKKKKEIKKGKNGNGVNGKPMNPIKELQILIDAKYPLVYIVSHEESRVLHILSELCKEEGNEKILNIWSCSRGLYAYRERNKFTHVEESTFPPAVLAKILERSKQDSPAIYVLTDFHHYMETPSIIRMLRDVCALMTTRNTWLIILSPELKMPIELEKIMQVIDWPLPSPKELEDVVRGLAKCNEKSISIPFADKEKMHDILSSLQGMTFPEAENILSKSLIVSKTYDSNIIIAEKEQIIRKGGFLEYYPKQFAMKDVGGLTVLKDWVDQRTEAFTMRAQEFGLPYPRGMLMIGIPGCGKSLVCKVIAKHWNMPLLKFDIGKVFASLIGSSESNIRRAIQLAEAIAPCVLWLDEVDKSFQGIKSSGMTDSGVTARVFATLVNWLQEKKSPVFVAMTANDVTQITTTIPEVLRKGRIDEIFFVDIPDVEENKEIFRIHLAKPRELNAGRNPDNYDIAKFAKLAHRRQLSGAEIEGAIISGLFNAFMEGKELKDRHVVEGIDGVNPIVTTAKENMEHLRKFVESGRAKHASKEQKGDDEEEQQFRSISKSYG